MADIVKILSFHPFSLYANGGGNRILRRLYQGHEHQVFSLVVEGAWTKPQTGSITEKIVYASPITRRWMRWYLRDGIIWLREKAFKFWTINRLRKAAREIPYDVIHVVHHGPFSAALCTGEFCNSKKLWVSFHDHFSTTHSSFEDSKKLWKMADRRLVISEELGTEYQRLFGGLDYEIITDGVENDEISGPIKEDPMPYVVYFAGLLHIAYRPLFMVLADALDLLVKKGILFKLILRGTQHIEFLDNRSFEVEYRPTSLNNAELKAELDAASILYLPIKFTVSDFYLFSLSTKMIGYLGGKGAILYHGPRDSAACNLLVNSNAAISCNTLDVNDFVDCINNIMINGNYISNNAKILAKKTFNLAAIRKRFWQQKDS